MFGVLFATYYIHFIYTLTSIKQFGVRIKPAPTNGRSHLLRETLSEGTKHLLRETLSEGTKHLLRETLTEGRESLLRDIITEGPDTLLRDSSKLGLVTL